MTGDARQRHIRRMKRRYRSARRWTVLAAMFGGAAAVLLPYAGLGAFDAFWAAAAGGSTALAVLRWRDHRRLAALPLPPSSSPDPRMSGIERWLAGHQLGRALSEELRRQRDRMTFRGSAAADVWQRLDRAARAMPALAARLPESAGESVAEAIAVERVLRDLAYRIVDVERGIAAAPADSRDPLVQARDALLRQLTEGVEAYERLVAAAAECVAEGAYPDSDTSVTARLTAATDRLVGLAQGLGELRDLRTS